MSTKDGGPAFPRPASEFTKNGTLPDGNDAIDDQEGMSLRDYFAGKALAGLIQTCAQEWNSKGGTGEWSADLTDPHFAAKTAYEMADAMILARKPKPAPADGGVNVDLIPR